MNALKGTIVTVQSSAMLSLVSVNVDGDAFSAIVLEGQQQEGRYHKGDGVRLIFKETEVGLAKGLSGKISFRNRFSGTVQDIEQGEVLSKILLDYKGHPIESIITTSSAQQMHLERGDVVEWLVKTNEVSLMKEST